MKSILPLSLLLLSGCVEKDPYTLTPYPFDPVEVIDQWESQYPVCNEELPDLYIGDYYCGEGTAGCLISAGGRRWIEIRSQDDICLYVHELTHWLIRCTNYLPDGDNQHTDQELWGTNGFVQNTCKNLNINE